MNRPLTTLALGSLCLAALPATAQESGRVISSTPIVQQVAVPRQVCSPAVAPSGPSGAGAVMGAIAGGLIGNAMGHGGGRAAATALGVVGGAALGNQLEGQSQQGATVCTTQTFQETRTTGWNVVYEYGGRQYSVQMPSDPGPTVRLQVSPVGAVGPDIPAPLAGDASAPAYPPAPMYAPAYPAAYAPTYVNTPPVVYAPAPVYVSPPVVAPGYYYPAGRPLVAPIGLNFNFDYIHHRHR